ncbi:MAG: hypothetical protein MPJ50_07295 [Pirellulales bacterium]|nr:hypothetical protein [Pirellulales bacterium]
MDATFPFDLDVPRCTRRCAVTDRELAEGEKFYSVLVRTGVDYVRQDFAQDQWQGPPAETLAWWQAEIPQRNATRVKLAPNEVLWQLFLDLAERPEEADKRYVLTLFLIRRRTLKLSERSTSDAKMMNVFHTRSGDEFHVPVIDFDEQRATTIQQELMGLLYAQAESDSDDQATDTEASEL